ncbi:MAG: exosortase [Gammaproteobacteria bacterium]|nr:exosortase [Gammaproteobacteria bacterium]
MASSVTPDWGDFSYRWSLPAAIVVAVVLGMGVVFSDTLDVMVSTWSKYEYFYYGHCFLIVPISAWFIWSKRRQLARITPSPEYRVLGLILPAGFAWLLAYLAELPVAQQAALIACLILVVWLILGTRVAKTLAFPLGFLFFALPVSTESLLPFLMEFTADFTVFLVRISGFEVVQNGTSFLIGNHRWVVVELCSGNLYLALIITVGVLFSYLAATSWRRRLMLVGFTLTIPLISNVVRTYLIVLTFELDVPQLGPLKEHEIFAEVGFWLVVATLFLLGFLVRKPHKKNRESDNILPDRPVGKPVPQQAGSFITAGLTALTAVLIWPGLASAIDRVEPESSLIPRTALQNLGGVNGWQGFIDLSTDSFAETEVPVDAKFHRLYGNGRQLVFLYVCQYHRLTKCMSEMQHMQYVMTQANGDGKTGRPIHRRIRLGERTLEVVQDQIKDGQGSVLSWHWYRYGSRSNANRALAQLWEVWSRLSNGRQDVAMIILSTDRVKDRTRGEQVLQSFAESMLVEIEAAFVKSHRPTGE